MLRMVSFFVRELLQNGLFEIMVVETLEMTEIIMLIDLY